MTLIKDKDKSGRVMKIKGREVCINYCKIQTPRRWTESLLGSRIEYLSEFELDNENEAGANKDLRLCSGIV